MHCILHNVLLLFASISCDSKHNTAKASGLFTHARIFCDRHCWRIVVALVNSVKIRIIIIIVALDLTEMYSKLVVLFVRLYHNYKLWLGSWNGTTN